MEKFFNILFDGRLASVLFIIFGVLILFNISKSNINSVHLAILDFLIALIFLVNYYGQAILAKLEKIEKEEKSTGWVDDKLDQI